MKVLLRKATQADKEFLRDLNRIVYKQLVIEQFGSWDDRWQRNYFDEKWKGAAYQIILVEDHPVGTFWTVEEKDHILVREIQVLPEFQGRRIGTTLMKRLLKNAKTRQLPVRLGLLKANRARHFYERLGFRVYAETENRFYKQNAAVFNEGWSGSVGCRFSTPHARMLLERLKRN